MSDEIVLTTNWGMRRQHLALASALQPRGGGRAGHPLCTRNYDTWDQEYMDDFRSRYTDKIPRIEALPMCTRCAKKDPRWTSSTDDLTEYEDVRSFAEFRERALSNPEVREAYERALARDDGDE